MANSDRVRRRDNTGPKQNPSSRVNKTQSNTKNTQGRRQDDAGTQQSEPNITRQNRGSRQNVSKQSKEQDQNNE